MVHYLTLFSGLPDISQPYNISGGKFFGLVHDLISRSQKYPLQGRYSKSLIEPMIEYNFMACSHLMGVKANDKTLNLYILNHTCDFHQTY